MKKIPLTQGKYALVDNEDFHRLSGHKWVYNSRGYAVREVRLKEWRVSSESGRLYETLLMHRVILNPPAGMDIDHINHNGLDNRKGNMRICTRSQNLWNKRKARKSKYKGVHRASGKFYASIMRDGKVYYLGTYATGKEAALAYDNKALELFGEYANPNFTKNAD